MDAVVRVYLLVRVRPLVIDRPFRGIPVVGEFPAEVVALGNPVAIHPVFLIWRNRKKTFEPALVDREVLRLNHVFVIVDDVAVDHILVALNQFVDVVAVLDRKTKTLRVIVEPVVFVSPDKRILLQRVMRFSGTRDVSNGIEMRLTSVHKSLKRAKPHPEIRGVAFFRYTRYEQAFHLRNGGKNICQFHQTTSW